MKAANYFKRIAKAIKNPYKNLLSYQDYIRIRLMPRFTNGSTSLFNKKISFSDSLGFLHSLEEIFIEEQYSFYTTKKQPYIIDCGSNIGLSIIFFKKLYPNAKILSFEPDNSIFKLLENNIKSFNLSNIDLQNKAVWNTDTNLNFYSEGSLAGSTEININGNKAIQVVATDIKKYLQNQEVDLLKIDIEGAENEIIFHISEELNKVRFLFLEYHSISGKDQKLDGILECIKNAGFKYYIKTTNDYLKHPFLSKNNENSSFDLQLNIFCFRI